jgi:hypothetical protein
VEYDTVKSGGNLLKFRRNILFASSCSNVRLSNEAASRILLVSYLLGFLFDPEDVGIVFLRNVDRLFPYFTLTYPRRQ